jgi:uncharacterized protein (TIGR01440 family)
MELLSAADAEAGDILVVGCSTSEIIGERIGSAPSEEAGGAVFEGVYPLLMEKGIWLAAQCCEHLNRALVIEKEAADRFGLSVVSVVPVREAGGSWATWVFRNLKKPVVVENLDPHKAAFGIDIGETCIGMHLKPVAVMVRPSTPWIGKARVTMVRTRPKLIGGTRAQYG